MEKKVLLVIDMQEIYAGRGRNKDKYNYDTEKLIDQVNSRIAEYPPEAVFYFKSIAKGLGGLFGSMPKEGTHEAKFVERLKIVSNNIYERSKPDCMAIDEFVDFLRARNIQEIEVVGVDIGCSIGQTVVTATNDIDLRVLYNSNCMVFPSPDKSVKIREKFRRNRVTLL